MDTTTDSQYDPLRGDPSDPDRVQIATPLPDYAQAWVPASMAGDPQLTVAARDPRAWERLRCRHDFEFWCARCAVVKHKTEGRDAPLRLNAPQRRVARLFERQRRARRPIRAIMLKARQWGGSTLVQAYMAWIQCCLRTNWHSIICAQVKDTSSGIRGMFTKILDNYPRELWEGDEGVAPAFRPYERSTNVREISGRGCRVTVSSIENQDAVRGADFAMAHLSEVAYWRATPGHSPEDVIRAICGSVALLPDSLVVLESTANGVGNFFHREWLRSAAGLEGRLAVFVPWYEIEYYRLDPPGPLGQLSEREQQLRRLGCDDAQIYWYRLKLAELGSAEKMQAEFPTTADEAFAATGCGVFATAHVEALRGDCVIEPQRGEADGGRWTPDASGGVRLWCPPDPHGIYVAAVDIGGRSATADYSVVTVMRADLPRPEVVAQWRGHTDHDLLARKAMDMGYLYNDALLVVESNSLESGREGAGLYVLDMMRREYPQLYHRRSYDSDGGDSTRVGFHTNRATKEILVSNLRAYVRGHGYVERDPAACDELLTYELTSTGTYAAKEGCHDDLLMARAIALHVIDSMGAGVRTPVTMPPLPCW